MDLCGSYRGCLLARVAVVLDSCISSNLWTYVDRGCLPARVAVVLISFAPSQLRRIERCGSCLFIIAGASFRRAGLDSCHQSSDRLPNEKQIKIEEIVSCVIDIGILKLTLLRPTNSANLSEFLAGVVDRASLKSCELSGWILVRFRK